MPLDAPVTMASDRDGLIDVMVVLLEGEAVFSRW
jgi:hypothetical protein